MRNRHIFFIDTLVLLMTPALALLLRVEPFTRSDGYLAGLNIYFDELIVYTIFALIVRTSIFYLYGLYSRFWRYASVDDLMQITSANALASLFIILGFFAFYVFWPFAFPRSLPIIDAILVLLITGATRFSIRYASRVHHSKFNADATRVAIMGAGDAGAMIVREIKHASRLNMEVVGFLDDDLGKHDVRIHNIPVLGGRELIPILKSSYGIDQVIIAMPTESGKTIREVVNLCEKSDVKAKTMPGFSNLLDGTVSVNQLRDVEVEDLLRREPVASDNDAVEQLIRGQCVLVTGGGGSIGSELSRQIWQCNPETLVLLGHGENSIFDIFNELRDAGRKAGIDVDRRIQAVLADTRFPERIEQIVSKYRPKVIFHAAAHKHVPLMERNPAEAITNNVIGTQNMVNAAIKANVEHFVMVSTDKAVNPTNVMGASKRTAELIVHRAAAQTGNQYVAVRFGNVLGSRGSVIHTFRRQISTGGPVTITDKRMERYFMTIPEAVQLVLQAAVLGSGSEVFVLDMGDPVKIIDLAHDVITLSGLEVGVDIDIEEIGARPGEKLYEELFIENEAYRRTRHSKIFIADNGSQVDSETLDESISRLADAAAKDDRELILLELKRLIPEFEPVVKQKVVPKQPEPTLHPVPRGYKVFG